MRFAGITAMALSLAVLVGAPPYVAAGWYSVSAARAEGAPIGAGAPGATVPPVADEPGTLAGPPLVSDYSNSGCLDFVDNGYWVCPEDDSVIFTADAAGLHVLHENATYNCCADEIVIALSADGTMIHLAETEALTVPCDCLCCYDVEALIVGLAPGSYTVELCWFDEDTFEQRCYVADVEIPGLGPYPIAGPPADSPATPPSPAAGAAQAQSHGPVSFSGPPFLSDYSNSGCLNFVDNDYWVCPGDDLVTFTVDAAGLHALHMNATYNCCPDDIVVALEITGTTIHLEETEVLTTPCWCICCYDVAATVAALAPGTYTVEYCWYDYDTSGHRCHVEEIVIP